MSPTSNLRPLQIPVISPPYTRRVNNPPSREGFFLLLESGQKGVRLTVTRSCLFKTGVPCVNIRRHSFPKQRAFFKYTDKNIWLCYSNLFFCFQLFSSLAVFLSFFISPLHFEGLQSPSVPNLNFAPRVQTDKGTGFNVLGWGIRPALFYLLIAQITNKTHLLSFFF